MGCFRGFSRVFCGGVSMGGFNVVFQGCFEGVSGVFCRVFLLFFWVNMGMYKRRV